jgi:tetratricopeptide (TPR) repeat protein
MSGARRPQSASSAPSGAPGDAIAHLQIAEAGKHAALRGDHRRALGHYREAMRIAVTRGAPEVFFRHYLEATLESLELLEAFDDVLTYCERAIAHFAAHPPQHAVAELDLAWIYQRRGSVLVKRGEIASARAALEQALAGAVRIGAQLPLASLLLDWLRRGLAVSKHRVLVEQRRLHYFSVRPDTVGALPRADAPLAVSPTAHRPEGDATCR